MKKMLKPALMSALLIPNLKETLYLHFNSMTFDKIKFYYSRTLIKRRESKLLNSMTSRSLFRNP